MNFYTHGFAVSQKPEAFYNLSLLSRATLLIICVVILQLTALPGFAQIASNVRPVQKQIKIYGTVADSITHAKIENGVIHLFIKYADNSQKLQDINIGKDGKFSFSVASPNAITMNVFCLGYKAKILVFKALADTTLNITLTPVVHALAEVKITQNSQLRLIPGGLSIEPDAKNFSAATLLSTYLNFIPGLELSPQGNISFLGKPLEVYVDGKRSALSGTDLVAYLQGFNAKDLGKVDILTEPGAGFDASSKAIINLNIKKFTSSGLQDIVAVGLTAPKMYLMTNSLVYATPKLRLSASVTGNHSNFSENNFYSITSASQPAVNSAEVLNSQNPENYLYTRVGLDAKLSEKAQAGFNISGSIVKQNAPYDYVIQNAAGTNAINSAIDYNSSKYNASAYFKLDMKKGSFQIDFSSIYFKTNNAITNLLTSGNNTNYNIATNNNYYINTKQTWKFSPAITAEAGIKYADNNLSNTFRTVNTANTQTLTAYDESILAAYTQGSYTTKTFALQLGLRAENLSNTVATTFHKNLNYLNWFPSVVASFPKFIGLSGNVFYNSRIGRISYYDYLPYPDNVNAGSISYNTGNGNLLPEISNTIGINIQKLFDKDKSTVILKISKSFVNSADMPLPFLVNNSIINVPVNVNQFQSYSAQLTLSKKWDAVTVNLSPGYTRNYLDRTLISLYGQNLDISLNGVNYYSVYTSFNFKSYKGYNAVMSFSYGSRQTSVFGYHEPSSSSRLTINKSFLKDRLSTTLEADDPFNWQKYNSYQFFNGITYYNANKPLTRMLYLSVSYRIGSLKPTVKRYDYQDDSRIKQDTK